MKRGDRFVSYGAWRPASRLYIEVQRVARDHSWADIKVCTWAVMWSKRVPLDRGRLLSAEPYAWGQSDLDVQQQDHMAKLREEGKIVIREEGRPIAYLKEAR